MKNYFVKNIEYNIMSSYNRKICRTIKMLRTISNHKIRYTVNFSLKANRYGRLLA